MTSYPTISRLVESASLPKLTPETLTQFLQQHCQPWLQQVKPMRQPMYRCMKAKLPDVWNIISVRQDRRPLDSDPTTHDVFNELLAKAHIKANRSNSLFCTGGLHSGESMAAGYGKNCYIVVPIGNFDFAWSTEYGDLYSAVPALVRSNPLLDGWMKYGQYEDLWMNIERFGEYLRGKEPFMRAFQHAYQERRVPEEHEQRVQQMYGEDKWQNAVFHWLIEFYNIDNDAFQWRGSREHFAYVYSFSKREPVIAAVMDQFYDHVARTYKTDDLEAAVKSTHEIMIHCERALLIAADELHHDPDLSKAFCG